MRFEVIDVCYNTLDLEDSSFSGKTHKEQAAELSSKFKIECFEKDVLEYRQTLAQFEIIDRQLIAEQYYGNNIQYTDIT